MTVGSKLSGHGSGRDLVAGDVAKGVGWGNGAVVTTIAAGSNRSRGRITMTSVGTGQAQATATVTVTFPEPFDEVPKVITSRDLTAEAGDFDDVTSDTYVESVTATQLVLKPTIVPVDTKKTGFAYLVVE